MKSRLRKRARLGLESLEQRRLLAALTLSIADSSLSENNGTATAIVTRDSDTSAALTVMLASDDTSEATVPTSITIPAGQSTSPPFTISGVDDAIVDGTQTATITATTEGKESVTYVDEFSGFGIDSFWRIDNQIPGSTVSQSGGTLTIDSPVAPDGFFDSGLESRTVFSDSDFVASVDFRVPQGKALPWISLVQRPEDFSDNHVYGLYLYQEIEYRVWRDDNVNVGNTLTRPAFGDESTQWHRMRLQYDAATMTATSFVDDIQLNSSVVNMDRAVVRIFMKDNANFYGPGPTTVEFDNFEFTYFTPIDNSSQSIDVTDDDQAGFTAVGSSDPLVVNEAGGTAEITVALSAEPLDNVTLLVSTSDATEATLSSDHLEFTPGNWNSPQTVVVTGLADLPEDGDISFGVTFQVDPANSHPSFASLDPITLAGRNTNVAVTNLLLQYENDEIVVRNRDTDRIVPHDTGQNNTPVSLDLSDIARALQIGQLGSFVGVIEIEHQNDDTLDYGEGWKVEAPDFFHGRYAHQLRRDGVTLRVFNDRPYQNPYNRLDVNRDGATSSLDALNGINFMKSMGGTVTISPPTENGILPTLYYNVSGDHLVSALDSLQVINGLGLVASGSAEFVALPVADSKSVVSQSSIADSGSGPLRIESFTFAGIERRKDESSMPLSGVLPAANIDLLHGIAGKLIHSPSGRVGLSGPEWANPVC